MTNSFKREPRYFVFKINDMRKHLSRDKFELVGSIAEKLNAGRAVEGKVPLNAVVVESDWPEYEPVWAMIEARMTGIAQSKKTHCDCKNPSQCWESCGELGHSAEHVKVHQQEHGNAEDMYIEMHKHLNCPHCGGSGHIEDVKQEQGGPVGEMTPRRAEMFMTRFKHEEKMLGPNEQAALDYVIAMLVAKQEQGGPVAWNEDQAYAWGRGCYEIAQGATTGWKLFGQLTPKEQAYWVAKAAFEQATQQQRKPLTRDERENVFAEAEKLMDADDNLSWRIAILKATEAATALRNKHE